ncbi:ATP-binding cassette sub- B member 6, mitochondrial [Dimargaris verticillata]|uniref:ATP-binding cassette sub- B member 6, mitochondrial n=1 Tax=Dimargaris verticillata TaxID=2761393 RepID=A0A9W8BAV3_9FUNG|nr:ATP-binding cassette sub- B member 6, mitochondrial [Dimargaris verticillata]
MEPLAYSFRLHPTALGVCMPALVLLYTLGRSFFPKPTQTDDKAENTGPETDSLARSSLDAFTEALCSGGRKARRETLFVLMWVLHNFLLWESVVMYYALAQDPETPKDWQPWLKERLWTQVLTALAWWVYHYEYIGRDLAAFRDDQSLEAGSWEWPWRVSVALAALDLTHHIVYRFWPQSQYETSSFFTYWISPTLALGQLAFSVVSPWLTTSLVTLTTDVDKPPVKENQSSTKDSEPKRAPRRYGLITIVRRMVTIIAQQFIPLDLQVIKRFLYSWAYKLASEWMQSLQPWYYRDFLDSLDDRHRAFMALAKYGLTSIAQQVKDSRALRPGDMSIQSYLDSRFMLLGYSFLQDRSMNYHLTHSSWDIHQHFNRTHQCLSEFFNLFVLDLIPEALGIGLTLYQYQWSYNRYFMPLTLAFAMHQIGKKFIHRPRNPFVKPEDKTQAEKDLDFSYEALKQVETVKQFSGETFHKNLYEEALHSVQGRKLHQESRSNVVDRSLGLVYQLLILVGVAMCLRQMQAGQMKATDVLFFLSHFCVTYRPVVWLFDLVVRVTRLRQSCERFLDFIDDEDQIVDPSDAPEWDIKHGTIEFVDVEFGYKKGHSVLKGVSFTVPAGTTTAIVGKTGNGKTTILDLLMRFYDVRQGKILIDGTDIRTVKQFDLRKSIAMVPQEHDLLLKSIRYNILYGTAVRGLDGTDEEVIESAKCACIHDKIMSLPKGYDTVLGSGEGTQLSGGEKQRINIARGLIRKGKILLLDEATAALDMITEREVQENLRERCKGTTCVIIAHRLPTIRHADQILVVSNGGIVERGTFDELQKIPDGEFRTMWETQMKTTKYDIV